MGLDLRSFDAVRDFAETFTFNHQQLDVLIFNAGVYLTKKGQLCRERDELYNKANYLSPRLLATLLAPQLSASNARIVIVSPERQQGRSGNRIFSRNNQRTDLDHQKIRFAMGLNRNLKRVAAFVVYPGSDNSIWNDVPCPCTTIPQMVKEKVKEKFTKPDDNCAETSIYIASIRRELNGIYFENCQAIELPDYDLSDDAVNGLWTATDTQLNDEREEAATSSPTEVPQTTEPEPAQ